MEEIITPSSAAGQSVLGARTSESAARRKHPQLRTVPLQLRKLSTRPCLPAVGWASSFSARATCCGLGGPRAWGRRCLRCEIGFLAQGGDDEVPPSSTLQRSGVRSLPNHFLCDAAPSPNGGNHHAKQRRRPKHPRRADLRVRSTPQAPTAPHGAPSTPQTQHPPVLASRWMCKLLLSESHLLRTRRSARLGPPLPAVQDWLSCPRRQQRSAPLFHTSAQPSSGTPGFRPCSIENRSVR
jgi:hypothetical protein